ncbi:MAG TPA: hypothetical protein VGH19_17030 [Verrucomicrobiae bacterium]
MSIWKVILATLVIFGAGVITGGLFVNRMHVTAPVVAAPADDSNRHPLSTWVPPQANTNNPPPAAVGKAKDFVARFGAQLELTSEQRTRIEQIMSDSQKRTKGISDSVAPYVREEVRHTRELIRNELTAQQLQKYDEILRPKKKNDPSKKNAKMVIEGE